jgi:energy-converting hydrogenase Eha subunit A
MEYKRVFSYESRTYFRAAVIFVFEARVSINLMGRQLIPVAVLAVQVSSSGLTKIK